MWSHSLDITGVGVLMRDAACHPPTPPTQSQGCIMLYYILDNCNKYAGSQLSHVIACQLLSVHSSLF